MPSSPVMTHRSRWLMAALLSVVLLAQWVGLVHGVAHAGRGKAAASLMEAGQTRTARTDAVVGQDSVGDHEAGSSLCRLLDALAQPGPGRTVAALPVIESFGPPIAGPAATEVLAPFTALYLVRAPPLTV